VSDHRLVYSKYLRYAHIFIAYDKKLTSALVDVCDS